MPSQPHQRDLDPPTRERHGQPTPVEVAIQPPFGNALAGGEQLQRLLATLGDQNRQLAAHVRRLEAELSRSSAELTKLHGDMRRAIQDSLTDPLTGLANRRSFDLQLQAIAARTDGSASAQLAMADVDHFKQVNDAHGHDIGDEVLRIVGQVLLANLRRDGVVARLGGDEFGLLLPGASAPYAVGIASRLCDLLASRPLVVRSAPRVTERITLSIGVAEWRAGENSSRWFARADAALYEAKRGGRNCISTATVYKPESQTPGPM